MPRCQFVQHRFNPLSFFVFDMPISICIYKYLLNINIYIGFLYVNLHQLISNTRQQLYVIFNIYIYTQYYVELTY